MTFPVLLPTKMQEQVLRELMLQDQRQHTFRNALEAIGYRILDIRAGGLAIEQERSSLFEYRLYRPMAQLPGLIREARAAHRDLWEDLQ